MLGPALDSRTHAGLRTNEASAPRCRMCHVSSPDIPTPGQETGLRSDLFRQQTQLSFCSELGTVPGCTEKWSSSYSEQLGSGGWGWGVGWADRTAQHCPKACLSTCVPGPSPRGDLPGALACTRDLPSSHPPLPLPPLTVTYFLGDSDFGPEPGSGDLRPGFLRTHSSQLP